MPHFSLKDDNKALIVHKKEKIAALYVKKKEFDNLELRKKEYYLFIELISLIEYLKTNRYITIFPMDDGNDSGLMVMKESFNAWTDPKSNILYFNKHGLHLNTSAQIVDKTGKIIYEGFILTPGMYNWILENMQGLVVVSEELRDLKSNGFKTKEDRKFKKSQNVAWVSIFLAFFIGFSSLIIQGFQIFSTSTKETKVILNPTQFQTLIKNQDSLFSMESNIELELQKLKNDTIKK